MSRFDLIFLILDPQDEIYDRRLGRHLVSLYYKSADQAADELLDMTILRDYLVIEIFVCVIVYYCNYIFVLILNHFACASCINIHVSGVFAGSRYY